MHCGEIIPQKPKRLDVGRNSRGEFNQWIYRTAPRRFYCSDKCGQDYKNAHRAQYAYYRVTCILCGVHFMSERKDAKYCSKKCANTKPHPSRRTDYTGLRFHKLVAIRSEVRRRKAGAVTWWLCQCDCGNQKWVIVTVMGKQKSCGCLKSNQEIPKICVNCSKSFLAVNVRNNTCSIECRKAQDVKYKRMHNKTYSKQKIERARKRYQEDPAYREKTNARQKDYRLKWIENPKGERQWLVKSHHELAKIKRMLREGPPSPPKASPSLSEE